MIKIIRGCLRKGHCIMTMRQVIKMEENLLFFIKGRILRDGGELEGGKLLMERHLCEPHRPKRYLGIVK